MRSTTLAGAYYQQPRTRCGRPREDFVHHALEMFELSQNGVFSSSDHLDRDDSREDLDAMGFQFSGSRDGRIQS